MEAQVEARLKAASQGSASYSSLAHRRKSISRTSKFTVIKAIFQRETCLVSKRVHTSQGALSPSS
jgi:hypothetical protein